jgi:hypothetical protein
MTVEISNKGMPNLNYINRVSGQPAIKSRAFPDKRRSQYHSDVSLLFARVWAVIQVVLDNSESARADYARIVEAYELPGNEQLLHESEAIWGSAFYYRIDDLAKYRDNHDYLSLVKRVNLFILNHFNRHDDRINQRSKVKPYKSPMLFTALLNRSLCDHYEVDLAMLESYRGGGIDARMQKRDDRVKRHVIPLYKRYDMRLINNDVVMTGASMWYTARVVKTTLRAAANDYKLDPLDLGKRIKPYDIALGYLPR